MKISINDVEQVALLSRLELTNEEKQKYMERMNQLLDTMEVLNKVDTSSVEPLAHVLPVKNVFREDELRESLPREKILENAPDHEEGMFKVPKII